MELSTEARCTSVSGDLNSMTHQASLVEELARNCTQVGNVSILLCAKCTRIGSEGWEGDVKMFVLWGPEEVLREELTNPNAR